MENEASAEEKSIHSKNWIDWKHICVHINDSTLIKLLNVENSVNVTHHLYCRWHNEDYWSNYGYFAAFTGMSWR